jgi:uncharacterized lipoprotein
MTTRTIVALAAVGALAGCASTLDADYGNSVASLIKAQTANSATLTSPSTTALTGVDPDYANGVVNAMRKDVSKPEEIRKPIEMAVISSGGGGW